MTNVIRKTPDTCGIYHYAINVINPGDYPMSEWIHDPDVSALTDSSPVVPTTYWKVVSDDGSPEILSVVEMSQGEKDAVDACIGGEPEDMGDQTFDDDEDAAPDVIWSSEKITNTFSQIDRVCMRSNGNVTQAFQQTYVNVQFDAEVRCDTGHYTYDPDDGGIIITNAGWYLLMASLAVETTSTSRNVVAAELRLDGGTVAASKAFTYHYGEDSTHTLAARGTFYASAGQKVQIFMARDWGKSTIQTLPNSCLINILNVDSVPSGSPYGSPE